MQSLVLKTVSFTEFIGKNIHFSLFFIFLAVRYELSTKRPDLTMASYLNTYTQVLHNLVQQNIHFYQLGSYYVVPHYPTVEQDISLNMTSQQILEQIKHFKCRVEFVEGITLCIYIKYYKIQRRICKRFGFVDCLKNRSQSHYLILHIFYSYQSRLFMKIGFDSVI